MSSIHSHRKDEHLSLAQKYYDVDHQFDPFDQIRIIHQSLPELGIDDVSLATSFGELSLPSPFYIEAMTGGSSKTGEINAQLATIAAKLNLPIASGSQSIAVKDPAVRETFSVLRKNNPNGIVFANLSANATVDQAKYAIEMLDANAIEIHVNTIQELVMPEGQRSFYWLHNISELVSQLPVPVIVKEVGFGMEQTTIKQLIDLGVQYINVSGRGGTNFVHIENRRNHENNFDDFATLGQTSVESLFETRPFQNQLHVAASGGVVSALDVIKAGILGAQAVGIAGQFLHELIEHGSEGLLHYIENWQTEIKALLVLTGCHNFNELHKVPFVADSELNNYLSQRELI